MNEMVKTLAVCCHSEQRSGGEFCKRSSDVYEVLRHFVALKQSVVNHFILPFTNT